MKLSAAHQLTATITPSIVSMMSGDKNVLSVDEQVILATTALMPSVIAVMNLATLPRTAPTRFLYQECHATMADLTQGIDKPTTRGTDHTPIIAPDIGYISAGYSPTLIPTVTEAAVLVCTHNTPLAANHAAPQPMDVLIILYAMIPSVIVALHPTLTIPPVGATHATPWTIASLASAAPTMQHKDLIPGKSSNAQDPQLPINPTTLKLSPSRTPLQTLYQILTVTVIL